MSSFQDYNFGNLFDSLNQEISQFRLDSLTSCISETYANNKDVLQSLKSSIQECLNPKSFETEDYDFSIFTLT